MTPPRLARLLVRVLAPHEIRQTILDDLDEVMQIRRRDTISLQDARVAPLLARSAARHASLVASAVDVGAQAVDRLAVARHSPWPARIPSRTDVRADGDPDAGAGRGVDDHGLQRRGCAALETVAVSRRGPAGERGRARREPSHRKPLRRGTARLACRRAGVFRTRRRESYDAARPSARDRGVRARHQRHCQLLHYAGPAGHRGPHLHHRRRAQSAPGDVDRP